MHIYKDFEVYNGLFTAFLILAKYIDHNKFDLNLCLFNYNGSRYGKEFVRLGGKIYNLNVKWQDSPLIVYKLIKFLKKEKPDIVQTHVLKPNLYGRIASIIAKCPITIGTIWTLKDTAFNRIRRLRDALIHPLNRCLDKFSDSVIVISNAIKMEWDRKQKSCKYKVIYLPFTQEKFVKNSFSQSGEDLFFKYDKNCNDNEIRIGTVSRLSEEKGLQYLIKAFAEVKSNNKNAKLYIAGSGNYEGKLKKLANKNHLEKDAIFLGHVHNVYTFLKEVNLFVLTSRSESLGVAIMEAMSVGLPVVASDVGGIPEIVENNKSGILVPSRNVPAIAKAINHLIENPTLREKMGNYGKKIVNNKFNIPTFISKTENLYYSLAAGKGII